MHKFLKLNKIMAVAALGILLAGCGTNAVQSKVGDNSGKPVSGGVLNIALANDVDGLDPQRTVSASTFEVTNNIYDTLIGTDAQGNLVPRLATKWSTSDGITWTFQLRKDVKFQNGSPMTAEDVIFSLRRLMGKQSPRAADYAIIRDIKADTPEQITITLKRADAPFLSSLAMPWAAIVPREAAGQLKTDPVGTGPFMLKEWIPQQKVVLEKNPYYYRKDRPYLNGVDFQIIPDPATQLVNVENGQIQIATISGEQAEQVKNDSQLVLYVRPSNAVQVLAMNNKAVPLNKLQVRQAIAMAIDKNAVIQGSDWGYGQKIGSHLSPIDPYYVDENNVLPYDPVKAKALLQQAGYAQGLNLTLALPQPYAIHIKAGQVIANQLKQIGINVKLETVDWGKWLKDVYSGRNYEMTIIAHTGRLDPDAMLSRYASDSKENYMNYANATVDRLLKEGVATTGQAARKKIYAQIQDILARDVPAVYLQAPDDLLALSKAVHGFTTYPIDIYDLTDVYLTGQQRG